MVLTDFVEFEPNAWRGSGETPCEDTREATLQQNQPKMEFKSKNPVFDNRNGRHRPQPKLVPNRLSAAIFVSYITANAPLVIFFIQSRTISANPSTESVIIRGVKLSAFLVQNQIVWKKNRIDPSENSILKQRKTKKIIISSIVESVQTDAKDRKMSHRSNECRIYVGNLPPDIRTKDIQDLFHKFGKVTFVDLKNRRGPPFAFVEFEDPR